MHTYDAVLFDLDGTISDSAPGITRSVAHAFERLGMEVPPMESLRVFIGPPLSKTFPEFGVPEERVRDAIAFYRELYLTEGLFENEVYEGFEELLQKLKADGLKLYVATSKPEPLARTIIDHFGLTHYFDEIAGASMDASRETKDAVIRYLLEKIGENQKAVMVGDTFYDVEGANIHHLPCIGVSWGFGTKEDMLKAGAVTVVDTMEELYRAV
ncbi:MAG: HAD family hydrolase [Solobacterium sp.]|nr:HAD family hydrolase [Solobacterium sp.]